MIFGPVTLLSVVGCDIRPLSDTDLVDAEPSESDDIHGQTDDSVGLYIAVHLESTWTGDDSGALPGSQPYDTHEAATLQYVDTFWPTLQELVAVADIGAAKLNLLFNPQWGKYINEDPHCMPSLGYSSCLEEVHSWEANGHAIGLHHHGMYHGSWNGYTNRTEWKQYYEGQDCEDDGDDGIDPTETCTALNDPFYLGTAADMMTQVHLLTANGSVSTATLAPESVNAVVGTDADRSIYTDWPYE